SFDTLKSTAREAIANCEKAAQQNPNEPRFRYQLARALQFTDRPKAFLIHQKLIQTGYPAAYDNLGWMYFTDKKDTTQAVNMFRLGVQAGDPDSMISLAEMIDRGVATTANPSETKLELYARAARLGS